mmetsp:Transcript_133147/g.385177  ORF Transcript_133147/g.385177 Transcript_133147/m.385177 type:complete len:278 (+) Transcript_133147:476-1309(+)
MMRRMSCSVTQLLFTSSPSVANMSAKCACRPLRVRKNATRRQTSTALAINGCVIAWLSAMGARSHGTSTSYWGPARGLWARMSAYASVNSSARSTCVSVACGCDKSCRHTFDASSMLMGAKRSTTSWTSRSSCAPAALPDAMPRSVRKALPHAAASETSASKYLAEMSCTNRRVTISVGELFPHFRNARRADRNTIKSSDTGNGELLPTAMRRKPSSASMVASRRSPRTTLQRACKTPLVTKRPVSWCTATMIKAWRAANCTERSNASSITRSLRKK